MNIYKLRRILEHIKSQGKFPTDMFGEILSIDELVLWYGLDKQLTAEEQREVKKELAQLVETEKCIDMLKMQQ